MQYVFTGIKWKKVVVYNVARHGIESLFKEPSRVCTVSLQETPLHLF